MSEPAVERREQARWEKGASTMKKRLLIARRALVWWILAWGTLSAVCSHSATTEPLGGLSALSPNDATASTSTLGIVTPPARAVLDWWRAYTGRQAVASSRRADNFCERLTSPVASLPPLAPSDWPSASASDAVLELPHSRSVPALAWRPTASRRPHGLLTGKIVYCSGGHGWTCDNTSTSLWYTQRPLSFGIVEDYGNLDQLNLFADAAWRAGATVVPMRPLGYQPEERILDNTDRSHVRFEGQWYDSDSPIYYGRPWDDVPYRVAIAATSETARARYTPYLPTSDYYPVYCWARDGADRVEQVYRIRHAGGYTEVSVDHRRVGKGWVYLGEYYFTRGTQGYVEITNRVDDPRFADGRHVVVADAIRFGNGRGDISRGGGISKVPREEEASRYWVERMLPVGAPPLFEPNEVSDQDNNVGSPPRMSSYMNRETEGSFFDRIYLGFHTNAVGKRGVVGLFNKDPDKRPDFQQELAELVARQLNEDMSSATETAWPVPWEINKKLTDSHINFGEIRRDAIANEMAATIIEVAFHDNPLDAALIRDPRFRTLVADSAVKAIVRFFRAHGALPSQEPTGLPPEPTLLRAEGLSSTSVQLVWSPPKSSHVASSVSGYRVYYSADGFAFDGGHNVGQTTEIVVTGLPAGEAHFFRVTAINPAGESRPSAVLGAFVARDLATQKHLVVHAYETFREDIVLSQTAVSGLGRPLGPGGEFVRIIPRKMNARNYVAHWGRALAACQESFDSCHVEALGGGAISPTSYRAVMLALGKQNPLESPIDSHLLTALDAYVRQGGALLLSGTNAADCLRAGAMANRPRGGRQKTSLAWLATHTTSSVTAGAVTGAKRTRFESLSFTLDNGSGDSYPVSGCDAYDARAGGAILYYAHPAMRLAAAVFWQSPSRGGKVATLGFPFECVYGADQRAKFMECLLNTCGLRAVNPPTGEVRPSLPSRQGDTKKLSVPTTKKTTSLKTNRR